ncbi:MAG: hypothetical protein ACI4HQ_11770, partial [Acetatifactor sp.]
MKETAELLSTGARTMSYEYDALGRVLSMTDGLGTTE